MNEATSKLAGIPAAELAEGDLLETAAGALVPVWDVVRHPSGAVRVTRAGGWVTFHKRDEILPAFRPGIVAPEMPRDAAGRWTPRPCTVGESTAARTVRVTVVDDMPRHRGRRPLRSRVAELAGVILVAVVLLASAISLEPAQAADRDGRDWRACRFEDGSGQRGACVWDGRHMGNGAGRSYIVRRGGHVDYIRHARAHDMIGGQL